MYVILNGKRKKNQSQTVLIRKSAASQVRTMK